MALLETLRDDFNDNSVNGSLWVNGGAVETNQRMELSVTGLQTKNIYSQGSYNFNNSLVQLEVVQSAMSGASNVNSFYIGDNITSSNIQMDLRQSGTITVYTYETSSAINVSRYSATYNNTTMRYVRFRKSGTTHYFDTSPDNSTWTNRATYTYNPEAGAFDNSWIGWLSSTQNGGETATFYVDNLNVYNTALVTAESLHGLTSDNVAFVAPITSSSFVYGGWGSSFPGASYFGTGSNASVTPLVVQDALHGHTADNLTLTHNLTLAVQDSSHAHTADNLTLVQNFTLVVADATHAHVADNIVLVQNFTLVVQDSTHAHDADNIVLISAGVISPNDAFHDHTADNLTLVQIHNLTVQDGLHAHSVDNLTLVQQFTLAVQDALHNHTADNLVLVQLFTLAVQEALHSHTADNLVLAQNHVLSVNEATHGHTADSLSLIYFTPLTVQKAYHLHTADNIDFVILLKFRPQPPNVILTVPSPFKRETVLAGKILEDSPNPTDSSITKPRGSLGHDKPRIARIDP